MRFKQIIKKKSYPVNNLTDFSLIKKSVKNSLNKISPYSGAICYFVFLSSNKSFNFELIDLSFFNNTYYDNLNGYKNKGIVWPNEFKGDDYVKNNIYFNLSSTIDTIKQNYYKNNNNYKFHILITEIYVK